MKRLALFLLFLCSTAHADITTPTEWTEEDGSPSVSDPWQARFTNGSVTNNGDGTVSISTGGGGGAPIDAAYLTISPDSTLTQERILTMGTYMMSSDSGVNAAYRISMDPTTLNTPTFGNGTSGMTWTFDTSGSVDPVVNFNGSGFGGSGTVDLDIRELYIDGLTHSMLTLDRSANTNTGAVMYSNSGTLAFRMGLLTNFSGSSATWALADGANASTGNLMMSVTDAGTTSTVDINGSLQVASLTSLGSITFDSPFRSLSKFVLRIPSDGIWTLTNWGETDWGRINLGGTTSSFPAIKRSGAGIAIRVADDSADGSLTALNGTFSGFLKIQAASSPTIDEAGKIAVDTTNDQFKYGGTGGGVKVLIASRDVTAYYSNLTAADDHLPFWTAPWPVTIKRVGVRMSGDVSTFADIRLEDAGGNAMTHTTPTPVSGDNTVQFQAVTANNTLNAGEGLALTVTNTPGSTTNYYIITAEYEVTAA